MQLTRKQFFAALFAPVLAALGLKPAAKVYRTIGLNQFINTNIVDSSGSLTPEMFDKARTKLRKYRSSRFGLRTTEIQTPHGSFVMVDNQALRNHAQSL